MGLNLFENDTGTVPCHFEQLHVCNIKSHSAKVVHTAGPQLRFCGMKQLGVN